MRLPTVLLHDHLDGGLRPQTVIELAQECGHSLPTTGPEELAAWFDRRDSGSLDEYLGSFAHTIAVMQTASGLSRVAREAMQDLAADGVVYAEVRFAPLVCTAGGLHPSEVVEAVLAGLLEGGGSGEIEWGLILCAMRSEPRAERVADLAGRYVEDGVVGFDLAGPETGHPPDLHLAAIRRARELGLGITLHAGESGGVASIARAVARCGADRIGHGVDILDDCVVEEGRIVRLGTVARLVRSRRIVLEVCPSSNLATKGWPPAEHPIGLLHRSGFQVTVNTDNRLMSRTSMSQELELARAHHGFATEDLALLTRRALGGGFCDEPLRKRLWEERIAPAYLTAGAAVSPGWR